MNSFLIIIKNEFLKSNKLIHKHKIKKTKQINIILKLLIRSTLCLIKPFDSAIRVQEQAFNTIKGERNETNDKTNEVCKTEWIDRVHNYLFSSASKYICTFCSPKDESEESKTLISLLTDKNKYFLSQENSDHKKFKNNLKDNRLTYEEMPAEYYLNEITRMAITFSQEKVLKSFKSLDIEVRVKTIEKNMKNFENGKGYQLNIDNYLKIILILQKARNNLPIIIMGETGCGKTYLMKFLIEEVLHDISIMKQITMHFGVSVEELKKFVIKGITEANSNQNKSVWLFFDEFNTSSLQSYVNEMMNDRIFSLNDSKGKYLICLITRPAVTGQSDLGGSLQSLQNQAQE